MTRAVSPTATPALWAALVEALTARESDAGTDERTPAIDAAYAALIAAMARQQPGCRDDLRFTADDLPEPDARALAAICDTCPLLPICHEYAEASKPTAGVWAGRIWTTNTKENES